jgi:hypothetical protein
MIRSMRRRSRLVLATAMVAAFAVPLLVAGPAGAAVTFDGSPGTGAPPPTLGPFTMAPFGDDAGTPNGTSVSGVTDPAGSITFSPNLTKQAIGSGWATWSHGYTGAVYTVEGSDVTIGLPAGTAAFYFYAEPNSFSAFDVTATAQDGTTSGPVSVVGDSGATYFGFYGDAENPLVSIAVSADPEAGGFAIGEFGIAADAFSSDILVTKVVGGTGHPEGPVVVNVTCTSGEAYEIEFPAEGGTAAVTVASSLSAPTSCTVEEAHTGGAASVWYSCVGESGVATVPVCSAAGPEATPISVNVLDPEQFAEVTIANTYVAPIAVNPRFTG